MLSVEELRVLHARKSGAIRNRLKEFSEVPVNQYFYELIYCLMTPQSSAAHAGKAVAALQQCDFLHGDIDPEPLLHGNDYYIRFHKTKAKHLLAAKAQLPAILGQITATADSLVLREWLVLNVKGLGWKEASHFLRNIGRTNLAILDRHILKNLLRIGVIRQVPGSLTSARYKQIEEKFHTFSSRIGIPMDELDLLFWSMETGEILK